MHSLVLIILVASSSCLAHYRGYEHERNLIEREEPLNEANSVLVECPVCDDSGTWMPSNEKCPIAKGNKRYKICHLGTYINKVCGNRLDCYRGPNEQCTVKRNFDYFGQKCAPGYYCNPLLGVCTGLGYVINSKLQYYLDSTPYSIKPKINDGFNENTGIRSD